MVYPQANFFKLDTDGAVNLNPHLTTGGGLIWDHHEGWVIAFRDSLALVISMHLVPIEVELNAITIIQLIRGKRSRDTIYQFSLSLKVSNKENASG